MMSGLMLGVMGWFPTVDLPLPLIALGGMILSVLSNRGANRDPRDITHSPSSQPLNTSQTAKAHPQIHSQRQPPTTSVMLPQLDPTPECSISPKINPQSDLKSASTSPLQASSSSERAEGPKSVPDPQLPVFIKPIAPPKNRVSFTIEKQD